jgi:hypothetical protein
LEQDLDAILKTPAPCDLARALQAWMRRARDQLLTFVAFPGKVDVTNNVCARPAAGGGPAQGDERLWGDVGGQGRGGHPHRRRHCRAQNPGDTLRRSARHHHCLITTRHPEQDVPTNARAQKHPVGNYQLGMPRGKFARIFLRAWAAMACFMACQPVPSQKIAFSTRFHAVLRMTIRPIDLLDLFHV